MTLRAVPYIVPDWRLDPNALQPAISIVARRDHHDCVPRGYAAASNLVQELEMAVSNQPFGIAWMTDYFAMVDTLDLDEFDAERASLSMEAVGAAITPTKLRGFASAARRRLRGPAGGYRRDHLRALAQRVEVGEREVRIMGSHSDLLRTLAAAGEGQSAAAGLPSFTPKWRSGRVPCIWAKYLTHKPFCLGLAWPANNCAIQSSGQSAVVRLRAHVDTKSLQLRRADQCAGSRAG